MLMPLGDDNQGRIITPYVTYTLIAVNIAVFFFFQADPRFTYGYSVVPAEIMSGKDLVGHLGPGITLAPGPQPIYLTIFSAMFMHGGFMHLAGNMLYLWIFGDNVEDAMGHAKFLAFYILAGILATFAHIYFDRNSYIPSLGASGAIAGVLGGYILMYPTRSVRVFIFPFGLIGLPSLVVIGFWAFMQITSGLGAIAKTVQTGGEGGVAYMAHVGGFVAGLLLVSLFRNQKTQERVQQRLSIPTAGAPDYYGNFNR
ncbi:MAG: hypothetical protein JWN98_580 [Abditibacteriota bacterium]|nr:hypothetical protein [Abditibacteriota bacterium]